MRIQNGGYIKGHVAIETQFSSAICSQKFILARPNSKKLLLFLTCLIAYKLSQNWRHSSDVLFGGAVEVQKNRKEMLLQTEIFTKDHQKKGNNIFLHNLLH